MIIPGTRNHAIRGQLDFFQYHKKLGKSQVLHSDFRKKNIVFLRQQSHSKSRKLRVLNSTMFFEEMCISGLLVYIAAQCPRSTLNIIVQHNGSYSQPFPCSGYIQDIQIIIHRRNHLISGPSLNSFSLAECGSALHILRILSLYEMFMTSAKRKKKNLALTR